MILCKNKDRIGSDNHIKGEVLISQIFRNVYQKHLNKTNFPKVNLIKCAVVAVVRVVVRVKKETSCNCEMNKMNKWMILKQIKSLELQQYCNFSVD